MWGKLLLGIFTGLFSGSQDQINLDRAFENAKNNISNIANYHDLSLSDTFYVKLLQSFTDKSSDSKINLSDAEEITQNIIFELVFGQQINLLNNILSSDLKGKHIYYFQSAIQQDGWSCGYWSCFNAEAINYHLNNNLPLNSESIKQRAQLYRSRVSAKKDLESTEVNCVARSLLNNGQGMNIHKLEGLNIENCHENKIHLLLLDVVGNGQTQIPSVCPIIYSPNGPHAQQKILRLSEDTSWNPHNLAHPLQNLKNQFFDKLKEYFRRIYFETNQPGAIHFVCNLNMGSHWILISIVKLKDRKPIMIILDSMHWSIKKNSSAYHYVNFLYDQFIRPYTQIQNNETL